MEQVPRIFRYGVVGSGRAASHFSHYLSLLNIPVKNWSRSSSISPEVLLEDCDVLLLLISDSAILSFVEDHPLLREKILVHFSGALSFPHIIGLHPLTSFGQKLLPLEEYQKVPFVFEEEGPSFGQIFPKLSNPSFAIPRESKPRYHAACVLAGNFSTLLYEKFFIEMARFDIPWAAAANYVRDIARNASEDPQTALTGPLVRGDTLTVEKNLAALQGDSYQKVYESFVEAYRETH